MALESVAATLATAAAWLYMIDAGWYRDTSIT
jgi:hypothetical protein